MIVIVSGLPRSGTSLMMKMLEAGGLPVLIDDDNPSTDLNPGGAYAYASTRTMQRDVSWIGEAEGKAVKVVAPLLASLPKDRQYKILFMERDIAEVADSTRQLVSSVRGKDVPRPDERSLLSMREGVKAWLARQPNLDVMLVDYNRLLDDPDASLADIAQFIGVKLNAKKMQAVPDKKHYRNRR
jgi:hypothetical protein